MPQAPMYTPSTNQGSHNILVPLPSITTQAELWNITFINHHNFFGNQDILVFSLVVFLSKYIYLIFEKKNDVLLNYILIFLISNIILWIKYESFIFVLISILIIFGSIVTIYKYENRTYKSNKDLKSKASQLRKDCVDWLEENMDFPIPPIKRTIREELGDTINLNANN